MNYSLPVLARRSIFALTLAAAAAVPSIALAQSSAATSTVDARPAPGTMRWADMPETLPYSPGKPPPFGYHVDRISRYKGAKLAAGAGIAAGVLSLATSAMMLDKPNGEGAFDGVYYNRTAGYSTLISGATVTAGSLVTLVVLMTRPNAVFLRNDLTPASQQQGANRPRKRAARPTVNAAPVVGRDVKGLSVVGRF